MDIRKQLQEHIDFLFEGVPQSRAAYDLREELLANSLERYEDLTKGGMEPQAAYYSVVESIGNVDELIRLLPNEEDYTQQDAWAQENRERSALTITISVGLYILAGVIFFLGGFLSDVWWEPAATLGLILAGIVCIIPTCMLVYNAYSRPRYDKQNQTVVEDFKKWNNDSKKMKSLRGAISSLLWTITTLAYLAIGFLLHAWHPGWMIFLIALCLDGVVTLLFKLGDLRL